MEELLGLLLQGLVEVLLQVVFEALAELGMRSAWYALQRGWRPHPALAALGYLTLGAGAGALSLAVFPRSIVKNPTARAINLLVTPLVAGLLMGALGAWRRRRGQQLIRLDSFNYGFAFALTMALVRYVWARGR